MLDEILEITCWLAPDRRDDLSRVQDFQTLAGQLADLSPIFRGLIFKATQKDPGVDLLDPALPQYYASWHKEFSKNFPQDAEIKLVVGAKPFLGPAGENVSSYRLVYSWGLNDRPDTVKIQIPMRFAESPGMAELLTQIVTALTGWHRCLLITATPSALKMTGKQFADRHSSGFGIWLTGLSPDIDLTDAHSVQTINRGQLIITAPDMFNLANRAALERTQRIDAHLMDSGALPALNSFPLPA